MTKEIAPEKLVPMDIFAGEFPLRVDLAYSQPNNLLFGQQIYSDDARLWLHEDLAKIVLLASRIACERFGTRMILYDGLRTVEAQEKMLTTKRVQENPHWLEKPRLLSPPGLGGHPRGMAIDMSLETFIDGELLDMGTDFDYFADDPSPETNPAHRKHFKYEDGFENKAKQPYSNHIVLNRRMLDSSMELAATLLQRELFLLPQEWWDFRIPSDVHENYAALSDADLPPQMRMTDASSENGIVDLSDDHFKELYGRISSKMKAIETRDETIRFANFNLDDGLDPNR